MDFSDMNPTGRSPRRELQGPRPTPLRINKDSHKIKKPPLAPQPSHPPQLPPRQPIIIYTVSPKIIHTTPGDFMSLVQRLTGSSSSSSSSSSSLTSSSSNFPPPSDVGPSNDLFNIVGGDNTTAGMISPAARYATIEKARSPMGKKVQSNPMGSEIIGDVEGVDMSMMSNHGVMERTNMFQGILSPGPASLSPIPSSFFSPPSSDPSMISFLQNLSPMLHSNNRSSNFMDGIVGSSFIVPSPSNFVSPQSFDLFNIFLD